MVKDLHDPHAGNGFSEEAVEFRKVSSHFSVGFSNFLSEHDGSCNHQRYYSEGDQRQLPVEPEHDHHNPDKGEHVFDGVNQNVGVHFVEVFNIVGSPGHDSTYVVLVEVCQIQVLQVLKDLLSDGIDNRLTSPGQNVALHVGEEPQSHHQNEIHSAQLHNRVVIAAPDDLGLCFRHIDHVIGLAIYSQSVLLDRVSTCYLEGGKVKAASLTEKVILLEA